MSGFGLDSDYAQQPHLNQEQATENSVHRRRRNSYNAVLEPPIRETAILPAELELPTLDSLHEEQRSLRAELARWRRHLRLELALEFATDAVIVLAATAALLVLLDWWFRFGTPVRIALLVVSLAGTLTFLGVRAFRRWRASRLDELSLAMTLDRFRPGTGQQIADVLQLPDLLSEPAAWASPAMVRLAVHRACEALSGSDWGSLWNRQRTAVQPGALLVGLLVPRLLDGWLRTPLD